MPLENLEDGIRMLQRFIAFYIPRRTLRLLHVLPRIRDVLSSFRIIAGEQTIQVLGVLIVLRDDHRCIGIRHHIVMEIQLIFQQVINNRTQKHHVRAAANANVAIRKRRRARVTRIHVNDAGTPLLGFHHPLESHWVALGHIRTLNDDAVRIRHILQRLGCAAAAKRSS